MTPARSPSASAFPHYVLDYESRFKETVIDRFAESYVAGETPVPCVECNQSIKFRDLLATARELGARCWRPAITSPHVFCRTAGARSIARASRSATRAISCLPPRASSSISCASRSATRSKAETRELARRFGLPVADKHDSQDICFVPSGRYTDVIERLKPGAAEPGDIVDARGPRARASRRHHPFHGRTAARAWHRGRSSALCGAARGGVASRRRRPARGAAHQPDAAARGQLAGREARSIMRCVPAGTRSSSRCARRGRRSPPG